MRGSIVVFAAAAGGAFAQTWDPNKVYDAGTLGTPSGFRYIDANGGFAGWSLNDTAGTITNQAPSANPGGVGGMAGNFFSVVAGKQKHTTSNWGAIDGSANTRTALFWRLYVPSSPAVDKFPSIQVRTHNRRHHLDFSPNATPGGGCGPTSGWIDAEDVVINSGGRIKADGSGERYLPMTMDAWHTIRVEVHANGSFEAWLDEELGLSDVHHITATAAKTGSGEYIEIGVRSTISGSTQYWTNDLAWGQDTTATGGTNQIEPVPTGTAELCENGLDDDGDTLVDCADPACGCAGTPENTVALCTNGADDDCDGVIDCDDADCAGVATETTLSECSDGTDQDCDGLVDCADPDCSGNAHCDPAAPHYALTMVRQVGDWQNGCTGVTCNSAIYFSVYDEFGAPVNGVTLKNAYTPSETAVTSDPDGGGDQQGGHGRFIPPSGLSRKVYRWHVTDDAGGMVSSDVTPDLFANIPPHFERSAWQIEFIRKSQRSNTGEFTPESPTYKFDAVEMNAPPGPNATLLLDDSGLGDLDFGPGGAGTMTGQTFKATVDRILSARVEASIGFAQVFQYQLSIHELLNNPPTSVADIGPQIGATRQGPANMFDSEWWKQMVLWPVDGQDSVPVTPGETYFLKIVRINPSGSVNVFVTNDTEDYYPDGMQFREVTPGGAFGNDDPEYDVVGIVVGGTFTPPMCIHDPVFDASGPTPGVSDGSVDNIDFNVFESCATGPSPAAGVFDALSNACKCMDRNGDNAISQEDFGYFQLCYTGMAGGVDPACDD